MSTYTDIHLVGIPPAESRVVASSETPAAILTLRTQGRCHCVVLSAADPMELVALAATALEAARDLGEMRADTLAGELAPVIAALDDVRAWAAAATGEAAEAVAS